MFNVNFVFEVLNYTDPDAYFMIKIDIYFDNSALRIGFTPHLSLKPFLTIVNLKTIFSDLPPAGVRGHDVLRPGGRHGKQQAGHGRGDGRPRPRQAGGGGEGSAGPEEFPSQQLHPEVLPWPPGQSGEGGD